MKQLEERCKGFIKGSRSYKDTVQGLCSNQMNFAESLEDFCGGTDEDSTLLGLPLPATLSPHILPPEPFHCFPQHTGSSVYNAFMRSFIRGDGRCSGTFDSGALHS